MLVSGFLAIIIPFFIIDFCFLIPLFYIPHPKISFTAPIVKFSINKLNLILFRNSQTRTPHFLCTTLTTVFNFVSARLTVLLNWTVH